MPTLQKQDALVTKAQFALGCAAAAGLLVFYLLDYRPHNQQLAEVQKLIVSHQDELRANQSKSGTRNRIAAANEKLRVELDQIRKPSKRSELPDLIKEITLFGQQASLKKFDYKPGVPTQSELFSELPLALNFEGDFGSVFDFLRSSEDMQRLTRVKSMSIKSKSGHTGQVTAQVAMNIYFSPD